MITTSINILLVAYFIVSYILLHVAGFASSGTRVRSLASYQTLLFVLYEVLFSNLVYIYIIGYIQ